MTDMKYEAKTFNLPTLKGISQKQVDEHLKLYQGYVTHVNKLYEELSELSQNVEKNGHMMQELRRRLGFEFNGMRLHEYYFGDLEGGANPVTAEMKIFDALSEQFGTLEKWVEAFKNVMARGPGWMLLNYDPEVKRFHHNWVTLHDEGHLATLPVLLAVDVWEHAFMVDYLPGDKGKYISAYLDNLNWNTIEARFLSVK